MFKVNYLIILLNSLKFIFGLFNYKFDFNYDLQNFNLEINLFTLIIINYKIHTYPKILK